MELHVVLVEPEIPPNTGNAARTCAAVGARLHLIEPLGFSLEDRHLKRAGLDYWPLLDLEIHHNWTAFIEAYPDAPLWLMTTKAARRYDRADFKERVFLVFGKETAGLPENLLARYPERCLRIPMKEEARSLNLGNAVAITVYEACRQSGFLGLREDDPDRRFPQGG